MRLIDTRKLVDDHTISFQEFYTNNTPDYAILSHTWEDGQEVLFQDCNSASAKSRTGYDKIVRTCKLAVKAGIAYAWVDTCCIDKSSSADLSEAINSMFKWYRQAKICYAFLADLGSNGDMSHCRWFRRGWTLQELIAPKEIRFYDQSWGYVGSKTALIDTLGAISGIDTAVLAHDTALSSVLVATRLSWAANRETTREEDIAYCLLGIFDINMPMLYGEGLKAFTRLQEEIMRATYDLSIFAWTPAVDGDEEYCGFLAQSPNEFRLCSEMYRTLDPLGDEGGLSVTNKGIRLTVPHCVYNSASGSSQYYFEIKCTSPKHETSLMTIPMRKISPDTFVRARFLPSWNERTFFNPQPALPIDWAMTHTFLLLKRLPAMEWNDGHNLISSARFAAVKIRCPESFSSYRRIVPVKNWDEQDRAFISTRHSSHNWGAFTINDGSNIEAIFVCFWDAGFPEWTFQGTLVDTKACKTLWRDVFQFAQLYDWKAARVKIALEEAGVTLWSSGPVHTTTMARSVEISFNVTRDDDKRVCSGPLWNVQIERRPIMRKRWM